MITIKSPREIETMAVAGRIVAETLALVGRHVEPGVTTAELDRLAEDFIRSHPGARPSFKGLYDFPATLCTSINQEIVHGIPSAKRVLHDGDILSVDVGVWLEGLHADSAATFPVGDVTPQAARLLRVTQDALAAGVAQAQAGNHVGDIGHAVQGVAEAAGYSVVRELVGHGIGAAFHEEPQVPNYGKPKRGPRLAPGMTIAIEPMVNIGKPEIRTLDDKWTVVTQDGTLSAHFEHTVAIGEGGAAPRILTTAGLGHGVGARHCGAPTPRRSVLPAPPNPAPTPDPIDPPR
jgi:methionyl aminopeptidase